MYQTDAVRIRFELIEIHFDDAYGSVGRSRIIFHSHGATKIIVLECSRTVSGFYPARIVIRKTKDLCHSRYTPPVCRVLVYSSFRRENKIRANVESILN